MQTPKLYGKADEIIALREQGMTLKKIGEKFGVSPTAVSDCLVKHGIPRKHIDTGTKPAVIDYEINTAGMLRVLMFMAVCLDAEGDVTLDCYRDAVRYCDKHPQFRRDIYNKLCDMMGYGDDNRLRRKRKPHYFDGTKTEAARSEYEHRLAVGDMR